MYHLPTMFDEYLYVYDAINNLCPVNAITK